VKLTKPSSNDGILSIASRGGKVVLYAWGLRSDSKSLKDLKILLVTPSNTYSLKAKVKGGVKRWKKSTRKAPQSFALTGTL
jgi:hypothetical protein